MKKFLLLSGVAIAAVAMPAHAQDAEAEDTDATAPLGGPVIVVTARKREEDLIDVPLSITALGAEEIDEAGIDNISDVALQTPGFSFRQGFGRTGGGDGGASVRPSIRGMSNILGAPNAGFFVDGIFVSGNITSYQLENLERVEVIRGPQAALYGRQTFAGAVNFVTRKPDDTLRAGLEATVGQYDHYEVSGYVSTPLQTGVAALEVNGRYYSFGGDYRNADNGKRDINAQQSWNVGAKLRLTPSEEFEAIVGIAYGEDRDKGYATYKFGSNNLNCFEPVVTGAFFGIPLSSTRSRGYFCGEIEQPDTLAYNNDELEELGYRGLTRDYWRTDLTLNYYFPSGWQLTSITAYNGSDNINGFDNDLFPTDTPSLSIGASSTSDFSQNVRLLSPQEGRIRGLVGAYYYRQRDGEGFDVETDWADPRLGQKYRYDSDDGVNNWAVYGMVEFDVTDALTVSAEARYQEDKIFASLESNGESAAVTPATGQRSEKYTAFLPRFTARYELTPDWNLYAAVAKGNKPGGFNDLPTNIVQSFLDDFLADGIDTFDEEQVWSYELGTKGLIPGTGLSFNVAGFYLDWTSQQLTQSQPYQQASNGAFTTTPFIVNAGASEIKGFELELFGRIAPWFDVRLGYAYNDATFKDFYDENTEELLDTDGRPSFLDADFTVPNPADVDGPNGQVAGNRLPQTPVHQINASGTLRFPMSDRATVFLRNDVQYESNRYAQVHNLAKTGDSYNWNIRAGFEIGDITVTGFVDNVLEDKTPLVVTRLFDFNRGLLVPDPVRRFIFLPNRRFTFYRDFIVGAPRKRQFGVTVNWRF
ncbi:TonB-dependent receptor [Altererythrobacter arenosus]|uniref:TonB-dependent receptor n=1 Tax=Altererythrobacter arenosus TaxID=3032592 RepID=A0ABY8FMS6_9SPHN|nr:TonB-dependent receptor [Altererythrobacter sp. CAU 1644]WFL76329.1 TonB-dependent receptor [Altererythrobacter sp. CAU 1644]